MSSIKAVEATGKSRPLKLVPEDFDRQKGKHRPDIGADEFRTGSVR